MSFYCDAFLLCPLIAMLSFFVPSLRCFPSLSPHCDAFYFCPIIAMLSFVVPSLRCFPSLPSHCHTSSMLVQQTLYTHPNLITCAVPVALNTFPRIVVYTQANTFLNIVKLCQILIVILYAMIYRPIYI